MSDEQQKSPPFKPRSEIAIFFVLLLSTCSFCVCKKVMSFAPVFAHSAAHTQRRCSRKNKSMSNHQRPTRKPTPDRIRSTYQSTPSPNVIVIPDSDSDVSDDDVRIVEHRRKRPSRAVNLETFWQAILSGSQDRRVEQYSRGRPEPLWDTDDDSDDGAEEKFYALHSSTCNVFPSEPYPANADAHECPICKNDISPGKMSILTACKHYFCFSCLEQWKMIQSTYNRFTCPSCRTNLDKSNN